MRRVSAQLVTGMVTFRMRLGVSIGLVLVAAGCGRHLCGNRVLAEISSPDGVYVAALFERNCGATTPYIRVVSLREANHDFDPERDADWVFTIHEQSDVVMSWDDRRKLRIRSAKGGGQPTQRPQWKDVTISFDSEATK